MAKGNDEPDEGEFVKQAREYWASQKSSFTVVRRILCELIDQLDETFTVDELHLRARRVDPAIALSTVYRNIAALVEADLLRDFEGRDDKTTYEKALDRSTGSGHIICTDCGKVIPLEAPCLVVRETATAREKGFSPEKITLRMEASCDELSRTGQCGNCAK